MRWGAFACVATVAAGPALAQDAVPVGAMPAWVTAAPAVPSRTVDGAFDLRLIDMQTRFDDDGLHYHLHQILKVLSSEGLAAAGNFSVVWQPAISKVRVNQAIVRRDGKVIDVLGDGRGFQVLRREANLENRLQLDGVLTAVLSIPDLRVGDEIETRWTLDTNNPVLNGQWEHRQLLQAGATPARLAMRYSWPAGRQTQYCVGEGLPAPKVVREPGLNGFVIDATNYNAPPLTAGAPGRYAAANTLAISDFRDWGQVVSAMGPIYVRAATLTPNSPVADEAARIAAASPDPMARANAALKLVQGQVRYFARTDGLGAYKPETADAVWAAKVGDCKGKTVLLLALLKQLGIDADAALVSVDGGDGLDKALPMPSWFNHVIVRARIGGKTYWMDGTRIGDRSVESATVPDVRWALPLSAGNGALTPVAATALTEPTEEWRLDLDARGGTDVPAKVSATGIFRGDGAVQLRTALSFMSANDRDTFLRSTWSQRHDWVTIDKVSYSSDDATGTLRLNMTGTGTMDWNTGGTSPAFRYEANKARLGQDIAPKRTDGNLALPVVVAPTFTATHQTILLPDGGKGYSVEGEAIDTTTGTMHYRRTARIVGDRFDMDSETRSPGGELSFAAAQASDKVTDAIFEKQLFVRMPRVAPGTNRLIQSAGTKPPSKGEATKAVLLSGSISDEDYPPDAVRSGAQGITETSFDIDVNGRIAACRITGSSGSKVLDDRTCELLRERFVYEPAHNRKGIALPETRTQRVKWAMPTDRSIPQAVKEFDAVMTYTVELDGSITGCKSTGAPPGMENVDMCGKAIGMPPVLGADGKPYRAQLTFRTSLKAEPAPPAPGEPTKK